MVTRDELFGLIDFEIFKAIDAKVREQFERVRPFDIEVGHVVWLVEKRTRLPPGTLFISPVRELRAHDREGIWSDLRISQQCNGAAGGLQCFLQSLVTHGY